MVFPKGLLAAPLFLGYGALLLLSPLPYSSAVKRQRTRRTAPQSAAATVTGRAVDHSGIENASPSDDNVAGGEQELELSEAGYLAAATKGGPELAFPRMKRFVRAVVEQTGGEIVHEGDLTGFVSWYDGVTHTGPRSLAAMLDELKEFHDLKVDWVRWPEGWRDLDAAGVVEESAPAAAAVDEEADDEPAAKGGDAPQGDGGREDDDDAPPHNNSTSAADDGAAAEEKSAAAVAGLQDKTMDHLGGVDCQAVAKLVGVTMLLPVPFASTLPTVQLAVCCSEDALNLAGRELKDAKTHWQERTGQISHAEAVQLLKHIPLPKAAKTSKAQQEETQERLKLMEMLDTLGAFSFCRAIGAAVEENRLWQLGHYLGKAKTFVDKHRLEGRLRKELQISKAEARRRLSEDFATACEPVKKTREDFPEDSECGREADGCGGYVYFGSRPDGRCTAHQSFCSVKSKVHRCEICDDRCFAWAPCRWLRCNGMKYGRLLTAEDVALAKLERCMEKCRKKAEGQPQEDEENQGCFATCRQSFDESIATTAPENPEI